MSFGLSIHSRQKRNAMQKVIIIVSGGNVQSVLADSTEIEVELIDYDNEPDAESPDFDQYEAVTDRLRSRQSVAPFLKQHKTNGYA